MNIEYKLDPSMAVAGDYTPTSEDVLDLATKMTQMAESDTLATFCNEITLTGKVKDFYDNVVGNYSIKI